VSIINWFPWYSHGSYSHGLHLSRGLRGAAEQGSKNASFCKHFRMSHQYLIGAIRVRFHGLSVRSQGPVSVPQKPSTVLFPRFILFLVIHALSIMASVIAHCTLDAGYPALYYEFLQAISLSIVNSSEWIG